MVAQAVEEQVEQPAGLVALFGCSGDEGHSAQAGHDVSGRDVAAESRVGAARHGVADFALDPEAAARLWQVSTDALAS
jgi:hypothetical protein